MVRFQQSDPWLLQAIIFASRAGQGTLADIVAAGDGLNHALFTYEELAGGLGRLLADELIAETNEGFMPTPNAVEIFHRVEREKRATYDERQALGQALEARSQIAAYDPGGLEPVYRYEKLSKQELATVEEEYRKEFWRKYRGSSGSS